MNLREILEKHEKWLNDEDGGEKSRLKQCRLKQCRLVRVVTEKDFKEADEVEKSEEGKVVVFKDPICEVERMKDTVLVYSINS